MLGAIFGKCGEYMKLDRDKSTFKFTKPWFV